MTLVAQLNTIRTARRGFSTGCACGPSSATWGCHPPHQGAIQPFRRASAGATSTARNWFVGSTLCLRIAVGGGLFSLSDGHALQGDGEVSGSALECPLEWVEVRFDLRGDLTLRMPRAETPAGWICFGLHEDLDEAAWPALEGMLDLLEGWSYDRKEALMLGSLVVDLRVTQVVNGVKGVHTLLSHDALANCPPELGKA